MGSVPRHVRPTGAPPTPEPGQPEPAVTQTPTATQTRSQPRASASASRLAAPPSMVTGAAATVDLGGAIAVEPPLGRPRPEGVPVPSDPAGGLAIGLVSAKKPTELPGALAKAHPPPLPGEAPVVLFVLGGPGAGKGTQCAKIAQAHGYLHLSAGDLLRAECASGSSRGQMVDRCIREGKMAPTEVRRHASATRAPWPRRPLARPPGVRSGSPPPLPTGDGAAPPRRDPRRRWQAVPRRRVPAQRRQPLRVVRARRPRLAHPPLRGTPRLAPHRCAARPRRRATEPPAAVPPRLAPTAGDGWVASSTWPPCSSWSAPGR